MAVAETLLKGGELAGCAMGFIFVFGLKLAYPDDVNNRCAHSHNRDDPPEQRGSGLRREVGSKKHVTHSQRLLPLLSQS